MTERVLTGRHVLAITVTAFAIIIGVNVTMAVMAVRTFPGLEVKNSYVASQTFDQDRAAQQALGWTLTASVERGQLRLSIRDRAGQPVQPTEMNVTVGRATEIASDQTPDLVFDGNDFLAPMKLKPGYWVLRMTALAADGARFKQRLQLIVGG